MGRQRKSVVDPDSGAVVPPQLVLMRSILVQDQSKDTEQHKPLRQMYLENTEKYLKVLNDLEGAFAKRQALVKGAVANDDEVYQLQMKIGDLEAKLRVHERSGAGEEIHDPGRELVLQTVADLLDRYNRGG